MSSCRRTVVSGLTIALAAGCGVISTSARVWASAPDASVAWASGGSGTAPDLPTVAGTPSRDADNDLDGEVVLPLNTASSREPAVRPAANAPLAAAAALRPPGHITLQKFQHLQWSPSGNYLRAQGNVQAVYQDPVDGSITTLTAQNVDYNTATGDFTAKGGIRLERSEGTITGEEIQFNFQNRTGYLNNAFVETDTFRLRGKRVEARSDGSYVVTDGVFTTCMRDRPDYHIRARKLTVSRSRSVTAQHITFYAGPTPLITLPTYHLALNNTNQAPLPLPGYNREEGVYLHIAGTPIVKPSRTFNFNLHVSLKRAPTGFLIYQQDVARAANTQPPLTLLPDLADPQRGLLALLVPPVYRDYTVNRFVEPAPRTTLFAILQNQQLVYNRQFDNLLVSRLPDVGLRFANLLGHAPPAPPKVPGLLQRPALAQPVPGLEGALQRIPDAPLLLNVSTEMGVFNEQPSNLTSGRFQLRVEAASQPILLTRRVAWRVGATNWSNLYTRGTAYNLFAPEADINYLPSRYFLFGAGYRYLMDVGRTPFLFDRRDIQQELRLEAQMTGPWAFGVRTYFDLGRGRAYDTELDAVHNFDCMQIGFAYEFRFQQFSFIFNLLPAPPNRARQRATALKTDEERTTPTKDALLSDK